MQRISIELGSDLIIDIGKDVKKVKCELIGMDVGKYLILRINKLINIDTVQKYLFKGTSITARYISKGVVYGFQTSILHFIFNPDKLIFIYYPDKIEEKNVRVQVRVDCNFPASIVFGNQEYKGIVVDISKLGCKFTTSIDTEAEKNSFNDFISKCMLSPEAIHLKLQLPGSLNGVDIICIKRNINAGSKYSFIGLEFKTMSEEDKQILYGYLINVDALPKTFNFDLSLISHTEWLNNVIAYYKEDLSVDITNLLSTKECEFGKWLYSEGIQAFGHLEDTARLEKTHDDIHNLVRYLKNVDKGKDFEKQKDSILFHMDEISKELVILMVKIEQQLNIN